ncbi:hypothetical protein NPIL_389031 [Nephila pilipes]|uniref:Uncharacterized protein n=1 Tax=Nephila pilipes TaxID=299642 RepID=A0A8X6N2J1_NEPPI|nr:hypothetical protein NPIL_389031 [Nephila pilipes]
MFHSEKAALDTKQDESTSRVAFTALSFGEEDPSLRFFLIVSQFIITAVTSGCIKVHALVATSSSNALSCVKDIIITLVLSAAT